MAESICEGVNSEIVNYVEAEILPRYAGFDKAHREDHARMVVEQSMKLVRRLPEADVDMAYVVAAYHDLGLVNGRENHHVDSGRILMEDAFLKQFFSNEQLEVMRDAVEDHRASSKHSPRSVYGMIVAEADRFIDAETIVRRTIQYGLANYSELDKEGHYKRMKAHLEDKYGPDGYLKIWIPWSDNADRLKKLHVLIADEVRLRELFERIFAAEVY